MTPVNDSAGSEAPPGLMLDAVPHRLNAIEGRLDHLVPVDLSEPRELEVDSIAPRHSIARLDAMIFVALTAFGVFSHIGFVGGADGFPWLSDLPTKGIESLVIVARFSCPLLLALSATTVLARLRRPRPELGPILCHPGIIGLGVVAVMMFALVPSHLQAFFLLGGLSFNLVGFFYLSLPREGGRDGCPRRLDDAPPHRPIRTVGR